MIAPHRIAFLLLASALLTRPARAQSPVTELHRLRIENRLAGLISVSRDRGTTWKVIGHVIRPNRGIVHAIQDKEFTAADWAPMGSVAATAVNALHLKFDQKRHACALTIQPRELLAKETADAVASYLAPDASIYTDIPGGTQIFADNAPFLGNPVEVVRSHQTTRAPRGYLPQIGDILQIRVLRPVDMPRYIELENRFDGSVFEIYRDGSRNRIAQVMRPVTGVGRFGGTQYAGPGRLRANHPGVICVCTSPAGKIGGFQIIPSTHASSPDLDYVRGKGVWMVLGPIGALQPDLEGKGPLYCGYLRPMVTRVDVRIKDGPYKPLPVVAGLKENALMAVTHIRITPEPQRAN
jgi:hypothetical protein